MPLSSASGLRRVVAIAGLLNLGYFFVEFAVARTIGSVSLFADSIDFLEDAATHGLVLIAAGWSARRRSMVGMALAVLLLVPGLSTVWAAWQKLLLPVPPAAVPLSVTGLGALVVNLLCAFMLARYRRQGGSLVRAAFLSARNDAIANIAIVSAGLLTVVVKSPWPDLLVGAGIFCLNLDAAREVARAAHTERNDAS